MSDLLTEKEKEQINALGKKFNVVYESTNYTYQASRRFEISRVWSKKLLKISMVLNILSIILLLSSFVVSLLKPPPEFFASTPTGKIYHLKKVR
jgi:hypothetical protein